MTTSSKSLRLSLDEEILPITWEDNRAVSVLIEELSNIPKTLELSIYGGFEQVGALGFSLSSDDKNQTAQSGDIMLYQGSQLVLFFGQNSWAYTKLGHIDLTDTEIRNLLDKDRVLIRLSVEEEGK